MKRAILANAGVIPALSLRLLCAVRADSWRRRLLLIGYILNRHPTPQAQPVCAGVQQRERQPAARPVNTVIMTLLSLALAVPLGVGGAIYLAEYANRDPKSSRPCA